jgi:hypothetical protein
VEGAIGGDVGGEVGGVVVGDTVGGAVGGAAWIVSTTVRDDPAKPNRNGVAVIVTVPALDKTSAGA